MLNNRSSRRSRHDEEERGRKQNEKRMKARGDMKNHPVDALPPKNSVHGQPLGQTRGSFHAMRPRAADPARTQGALNSRSIVDNVHRTEKVNFAARKGNQFWLV
jgi:hypothetical protein